MEAVRTSVGEVWTQWEGHVIDETFTLRRCLGGSDHSGVFLTDDVGRNLPNAALKLVPAIPTLADAQLAHWNAAARLSHPHLIKLFATGRCQLGRLHCLYAVMEFSDQNLAYLLQHRALTDEEVREMLPPLLDALGFLHSRGMVQGQLKPSNLLVVGDGLKLASDTIRPSGEPATAISMASMYDPPETRDGSFSTAGDIWALGVTLFEALTQRQPPRPGEKSHGVALPPEFPATYADVVRDCLSRRPGDRPNVQSLRAWIDRGYRGVTVPVPREVGAASVESTAPRRVLTPEEAPAPAPDPSVTPRPVTERVATTEQVARETPAGTPVAAAPSPAPPRAPAAAAASVPPPSTPVTPNPADSGRLVIRAVVEREQPRNEPFERRSFGPLLLGIAAVVLVGGLVYYFMAGGSDTDESGTPAVSAPQAAAPAAPAPSAAIPATPPPAKANSTVLDTAAVIHEEMPSVSHGALATVRGKIKVAVRITVDPSGTVVDDSLVESGASKYFARQASAAARKWKFASISQQTQRRAVLHFEFSKSGATGHLAPPKT